MDVASTIKLVKNFFIGQKANGHDKLNGRNVSNISQSMYDDPEMRQIIQANALRYQPLFSISYDGEKNRGEMGSIKRYFPDYTALRNRAWQSFLDSEVTQDVIKKYVLWVVGSGLKLNAEPEQELLTGIELNREEFVKNVERRFKIWTKSRFSTYDKQFNLHKQACEALKNALLAGDVLCVLRVEKGQINCQIIDGDHVGTPLNDSVLLRQAHQRGNLVKNGIELNQKGEHIAYFVRTIQFGSNINFKFERIPARGPRTGTLRAFLVYGFRYRINNNRGIPIISAIMELLSKLERYREAAVGSAEERAKIAWFITHGQNSTGENPLSKSMALNLDLNRELEDQDVVTQGRRSANLIASSTQKQVFNLPLESDIKSLASDNELNFPSFYGSNFNIACAAIGIPPEVALSKYDSNFSASRAALKDWEHTLITNRGDFSEQFYKPYYQLWLEVEASNNRISAPGLLDARRRNDIVMLEAYTTCRFTGPMVPHIDPLKEVKAEREKLGPLGKNIPLTTAEQATENLNGGDFTNNKEKFLEEIEDLPTTQTEEPNTDPVSTEDDPVQETED